MNTTINKIHATSASTGIAVGPVYIYRQPVLEIDYCGVADENIEKEKGLFFKGREKAEKELQEIVSRAGARLDEDAAEIFNGHIDILIDEDFAEEILDEIDRGKGALHAIEHVIEKSAAEMAELDNEYMRERAADFRDIGKRLQYAVAGIELCSLDDLENSVIVVSHDLAPSDTAQMNPEYIRGFVTELGGATSHVAIMAQNLEIPALVGADDVLEKVNDGDQVILDANEGILFLNPDEKLVSEYKDKIEKLLQNKKQLDLLRDLPTITTDGHGVELCANIGSDKELEHVLHHGADGVGLFRTEFLYMDAGELPGEEKQFSVFKAVAEGMGEKGVIIRTVDIGGDKDLPYLDLEKEENPFLGWRGVRMSIDRPDIFRPQLRAILRASAYGKVRIMYPMIINGDEIEQLNRLLDEIKGELKSEGIGFDEKIETGIMIETPAAALIADTLIRKVDFFSIGTNDLTQYTLAVDRGNAKIAHLYEPFHPGVLMLIKHVIDASHRAGKWTGMCGAMAGNEKAALLLLGLGLDEFSMSSPCIGKIKKIIRGVSYADIQERVESIMGYSSSQKIDEALSNLLNDVRGEES